MRLSKIKMNNGDEVVVSSSIEDVKSLMFDSVGNLMKIIVLDDVIIFCSNISTIERLED